MNRVLNVPGLSDHLARLLAGFLTELFSGPTLGELDRFLAELEHHLLEQLVKRNVPQDMIAQMIGKTRETLRLRRIQAHEKRLVGFGQSHEPSEPTLLERVYNRIYAHAGDTNPGVTLEVLNNDLRRIENVGIDARRLDEMLSFLVAQEVLSVAGAGLRVQYRINRQLGERLSQFEVEAALYHEGPLSIADLCRHLQAPETRLREFLDALKPRLVVTVVDGVDRYKLDRYHLPMPEPEGFETGAWDHFRAVFRAMSIGVREHRSRWRGWPSLPRAADDGRPPTATGMTYAFDLPEDHPLFAEIAGFAERTRATLNQWLEREGEYQASGDTRLTKRIWIYAGQFTESTNQEED